MICLCLLIRNPVACWCCFVWPAHLDSPVFAASDWSRLAGSASSESLRGVEPWKARTREKKQSMKYGSRLLSDVVGWASWVLHRRESDRGAVGLGPDALLERSVQPVEEEEDEYNAVLYCKI